jgi:serine/threonine protein kinase
MENGNVVEFLARRLYTDTTDCVCLALDIAHGVKYLHGEQVIHRDLKGYNILISPSLRAYIADFGLATFTDSGSATTLVGGAIMGTPKWLAPELIPHEEVKRHHTYASDIYAFALVCYEMFSGKVPFEDVEIYDLKLLLHRGDRPSLPADQLSRRRGLSAKMEDIIRDCWAQDPAKRPSAHEVVERLQLLRNHQDDLRPLNKIGTSFFTQLLRDQVDNPLAVLSVY